MAFLSYDVLEIVLSYLHYRDLIHCEEASTDAQKVLTRKKLWYNLLQYAYPTVEYTIDDPRQGYEYFADGCATEHNDTEEHEKKEAQHGKRLPLDQCPPEECVLCGWKRQPEHIRQRWFPQYLPIPFHRKDQAKSLGARWDVKEHSWYVGGDVPEEQRLQLLRLCDEPEKIWLAVPYEKKEHAKELMAKWDASVKSWYTYADNPHAAILQARYPRIDQQGREW